MRTNQTQNKERRREAPPLFILGLICPSHFLLLKPLLGLFFNSQKCHHTFVNWYYDVYLIMLKYLER
jgi:hypothetical protein